MLPSCPLPTPQPNLAHHKAVRYAQSLIQIASVTPGDNGCQAWVNHKLSALGFSIDCWQVEGVTNTLATLGQGRRRLALAGHTDVVPPGPLSQWRCHPYKASIQGNELYGRGAVDMKSGLAVMLAALEDELIANGCTNQMQYQFLMTSDEEGEAEFGTVEIVKRLKQQDQLPDYCLIAEPTASQFSGDSVRIGRRGAISARMTIAGKQGHVAYPAGTVNAVSLAQRAIARLEALQWDTGSDDFPGTSLQLTWINSGDFVDNLVPGHCELCFNIRFSHRYRIEEVKRRVEACVLDELGPVAGSDFELRWDRYCEPYFTPAGLDDSLIHKVEQAVFAQTGQYPCLTSSGGTSDGRFLASEITQVVELGLPNATIHQVNERVRLEDIAALYQIYRHLISEFNAP